MELGGPVKFEDLREQVEGLQNAHGLRPDDAFVCWFLRAYILDSEDVAKAALTGDNDERGIDAVYVDDSAQVVHILQGKFHGKIGGHTDPWSQMEQFTNWAKLLYGARQTFSVAVAGIDPIAAKKLREARNRLVERDGYRLVMYWVSTGKASATTVTNAETAVRTQGVATGRRARFEFLGGTRILELLHDYLYGVAPVVPVLELPAASQIVRTKDDKTGIVLRAFQVNGDDLAHLVDVASVRLFALNIRTYLRDTKVNKNMKRTLAREPQNFLYFNNGVTFVCDRAHQEDPDAEDVLTLINPQIINGQQTTRVLHDAEAGQAAKARVPVRVIEIPRGKTARRHESLISNIVQATNWQNSIKLSDLKSNDVQQVVIERGFRRLSSYHYARKKEAKRDIKARVGKGLTIVTRDELAQAVAGCRVESSPLRGPEVLFDEYYDEIFGSYSMKYYLCCYWLSRHVKDVTGKRSNSIERKRAKWLALYHLYESLHPTIKKRYDIFLAASQHPDQYADIVNPLRRMVDATVGSCARMFRAYKGTDGLPSDPTNFFKIQKPPLSSLLAEFWATPRNATLKTTFDKSLASFEAAFTAAELE